VAAVLEADRFSKWKAQSPIEQAVDG
jgi:hypothetical protein